MWLRFLNWRETPTRERSMAALLAVAAAAFVLSLSLALKGRLNSDDWIIGGGTALFFGLVLAALLRSKPQISQQLSQNERSALLETANSAMRKEVEERKRLEESLRESEERYRAFVQNSSEGIWRFELEEPIPVDAPEDEQIRMAFRHAYLAECNDAMARMYGQENAADMVGARLDKLLLPSDPKNIEFLRAFIRSEYRLVGAESHEMDSEGRSKYFLNNFVGIVEDGKVKRAWGTQTDITLRKEIEAVREKLNDQMEKRVLDRTVELMRTNRSLLEESARRKQVEMDLRAKNEELRENERRWRTLIENVRLIVIGLDVSGKVTYANPAFLKLSGCSADETVGKDWFANFVPPASHVKARAVFREVMEKDYHSYYQNPILTRVGEERMISWFNVRMHDENGTLTGIVSIGEDITERLMVENELRSSAEKFRSIAESAYDGILLADGEGKILYWNKSARLIFGYQDDEVIGRSVQMFFPERYQEALQSMAFQLLAPGGPDVTGKIIEVMGKHNGGREIPLELSLSGWRSGQRNYFACVFRDVTERKVAEAKLRFQARILSDVKDALIVTDTDGRVNYWNKGAEELYGFRLVDALGRKLEELVRTQWPRQEAEQAFRAALAERGLWKGEMMQQNRNGQPVFAAASVSLLRDERGQVTGHLTVARDVTERRKLESVALQAEKMAAMGQMAAGMAHELKAPLSVIYGYIDVVQSKIPKDNDLTEKMDLLKRQTLRCANLVNNMLDFSRKQHMSVEENFDLTAVMTSAFTIMQPYALQKAVNLERKPLSETVTLRGNTVMFEQVLINLCLNGIDATPAGGKIVMSAAKARGPSGFLARVEVSDTGKGISPEIKDKLFQPFSTTKESGKGTGLGLWLAREIITGMNGQIECQSEPGKGTTFIISLPLAQEQAAPAPATAEAGKGART